MTNLLLLFFCIGNSIFIYILFRFVDELMDHVQYLMQRRLDDLEREL